jgi:2-oxoglutarate ferredoxin oxidoreductase subunit alpha
MVYGAASTGKRVMTSSSSPGVSLMQEGLSYIAGSEVPAVIVDVMRGGPGLGNIAPSQSDYFQMVKTAGHGDYKQIVLAPATVQEAIDLTTLAFDLADKYRTIVTVLLDGNVGQMMEPAELPPMHALRSMPPDWAVSGAKGRKKNVISSIHLQPEVLETFNRKLQGKLKDIAAHEVRYKEYMLEGAELIVVGFGTAGRVAQTAVKMARAQGIPVGLLRPITLWPFPEERLSQSADEARGFLVVEMNAGQMKEDLERIMGPDFPIHHLGQGGGKIIYPDEVYDEIKRLMEE